MNKTKKPLLKRKWFWVVVAAVLVAGLIYWWRHGNPASKYDTSPATMGRVVEQVSVTGTVSPVAKADLAFEKGGVISKIYVQVGQMVRQGDQIASLDSAADQAAVASAQATLDDLSRNLTPEELAVQKDALASAERDALNAAHDGYIKAQNALFNYADIFYSNPQSANPVIIVHTDTYTAQTLLNQERINASGVLSAWAADLAATNPDPATLIARAHHYLTSLKSFLTDLSTVVNNLTPANASMTQAAINADLAIMNTGLSTLNGAIDSVTTAESALSAAQSAYDLKLAGNSSQTIAAQAAKVAQAKALLAQDTIYAPIDGLVTRADPNVGEYVAPGQSGFAVQNNNFKIEAYVPEADIAKVAVGDLASSTLDAYGSDTDFPARVIAIDPAETVLEGVPTYKVTLVFVNPDQRIRSGMTANLEILTHERQNVLTIPFRAVTDNGGQKSVKIASADGQSYTTVLITTGLKGSDGLIEVTSGLKAGDQVVTYIK